MALKTVLISPDASGMRLDRYLRKLLPDLPESAIRKLFASRDIKLDKTPAHREDILQSGQELRIYLPDRASGSGSQQSLRIVYEDDISCWSINPPESALSRIQPVHSRLRNCAFCMFPLPARLSFRRLLATVWTIKPADYACSPRMSRR